MLVSLNFACRLIALGAVPFTLGALDVSAQTGTKQSGVSNRSTATALPLDVTKLPQLKLVEDLRLDGVKEDFNVIGRVAVNRTGSVAVPMRQEMQVRVYDANGKLAGTVGRKGAGPGEFQFVGNVSWIADTMVVFDGVQWRVTYFGPDNKLVRSVAMLAPARPSTATVKAPDTTYARFVPFTAADNGLLIGSARLIVGRDLSHAPSVFATRLVDGSFRVLAQAPSFEDSRWQLTIGGLGNPIPFAFQPETHFASDGSRLVMMTADQRTRTPRIDIDAHEMTGRSMYSVAFTLPGTPIQPAVADSGIRADFPDLSAEQREGAPRSQWRTLAKKNIPAVFSPVERIAMGLDGRAWITMRPTPARLDVLVLDGKGTPAAIASIPPSSRIEQATSTHVWTTQRDEDGIPSVVRYRITR